MYAEQHAFRALTVHDVVRDVSAPRQEDYVFPSLDYHREVTHEPRQGKYNPDLLERTNYRATPSLNWISETGKHGEYYIKGTVTKDGLEGLTNTLKSLATDRDINGTTFNMRVQFLTANDGERHYDQVDSAYQATRQALRRDAASQGQHRGRSTARTTLPSNRPAPDRRPIEAEEDAAPPQTQDGPEPEVRPQCGNCKQVGHVLVDCVIASLKDGFVHGCPICNTLSHPLDDCPARHMDKRQRDSQILPLVWNRRFNKPMIFTHTYNWPYVVAKAIMAMLHKEASVDEISEKLAPPANMYPWTPKFTMEIMKTSPAELLAEQGSIHPREFDHQRNHIALLPKDFFYADMGSFVDVMEKYGDKEWQVPLPLTQKQRRELANRDDYMNKKVRGLLDHHGLLPSIAETADRGTELIKQEEQEDDNKFDFLTKFDKIKENARKAIGPSLELPPHFEPFGVEVRRVQDAQRVDYVEVEDTPDGYRWTDIGGFYVSSTWKEDHVRYVTVDEEGDWWADWVVRQYVHLPEQEFNQLPRGDAVPNKVKRMALATIDGILRL
ncbi:hypothetical protein QBC45DRAFT_434542 [Copromyces sp. CBS 386.78]|nr:hypothetical protein QBC45DRAFT_434542 [Copromyces sp. CBS 386.78]